GRGRRHGEAPRQRDRERARQGRERRPRQAVREDDLRGQGRQPLDAPLAPACDGPRHADPEGRHSHHADPQRRRGELDMGQKTHPYGFRLGIIKTWTSKWYEDKQYAKWLHEDLKLKAAIKEKFAHAGIAGIEIERAANKAKVVIATSRPGIVIGKRGAGVEQLKAELQKLTS